MEFQVFKCFNETINFKTSSVLFASRTISLDNIFFLLINLLFVSVKLQILFSTFLINILKPKLALLANQLLSPESLQAVIKAVKKLKITAKIYLFKDLQNIIKNLTKFLEKLS